MVDRILSLRFRRQLKIELIFVNTDDHLFPAMR